MPVTEISGTPDQLGSVSEENAPIGQKKEEYTHRLDSCQARKRIHLFWNGRCTEPMEKVACQIENTTFLSLHLPFQNK
uniref:Uncharacterized protein n=1 Tax=Romanomermis culicivorax TaxID=13658 RepID=A0A915L7Y3_ROMCU